MRRISAWRSFLLFHFGFAALFFSLVSLAGEGGGEGGMGMYISPYSGMGYMGSGGIELKTVPVINQYDSTQYNNYATNSELIQTGMRQSDPYKKANLFEMAGDFYGLENNNFSEWQSSVAGASYVNAIRYQFDLIRGTKENFEQYTKELPHDGLQYKLWNDNLKKQIGEIEKNLMMLKALDSSGQKFAEGIRSMESADYIDAACILSKTKDVQLDDYRKYSEYSAIRESAKKDCTKKYSEIIDENPELKKKLDEYRNPKQEIPEDILKAIQAAKPKPPVVEEAFTVPKKRAISEGCDFTKISGIEKAFNLETIDNSLIPKELDETEFPNCHSISLKVRNAKARSCSEVAASGKVFIRNSSQHGNLKHVDMTAPQLLELCEYSRKKLASLQQSSVTKVVGILPPIRLQNMSQKRNSYRQKNERSKKAFVAPSKGGLVRVSK